MRFLGGEYFFFDIFKHIVLTSILGVDRDCYAIQVYVGLQTDQFIQILRFRVLCLLYLYLKCVILSVHKVTVLLGLECQYYAFKILLRVIFFFL